MAPPWRGALEDARGRGVPVREARAGTSVAVGPLGLGCCRPPCAARRAPTPTTCALVALASAGPLDVLLTADAESDALGRLPLRPVEVLKVSHHGSEDAGPARGAPRLRPRVALISAGQGNTVPPPRPDDASALAAAGVGTWRTDRSGDRHGRGGARWRRASTPGRLDDLGGRYSGVP